MRLSNTQKISLEKVKQINYNQVNLLNYFKEERMEQELIEGAEIVALFCRLNVNRKIALPIRSSEMGLLILVVKTPTPITPVSAADFFKVKKPMITTMVNALVKRGYLEKIPSVTDKRSFTLKATAKAVTLVDETYVEYLKTMSLLQQELGKNFQPFLALLDQANQILLTEKD